MKNPDPLTFFQLKPIKGARVSEISETTAAAPVPEEERVNFHIGNPLQDPRQTAAYLRVALGLDIRQENLTVNHPEMLLEALRWKSEDRTTLDFFIHAIQVSSPYMPRGGYTRQKPSELVEDFYQWVENQQETLHYDSGRETANREIILASGGVKEIIRVTLFVIATHLENGPARILNYRCQHPEATTQIKGLQFENLADDEASAYRQIEQALDEQPNTPTYILIGDLLEEDMRRKLYLLSVKKPIFFIEANDAPNHLSMAREAKLIQRVIRLLSPGIFHPKLASLSTVFIAGNANYLKAIESLHFNLKGTPLRIRDRISDIHPEPQIASDRI